jgi:hypothetical protein
MYNYLLFRCLCFRNCDYETKRHEIIWAKRCAKSARIDYVIYGYIERGAK